MAPNADANSHTPLDGVTVLDASRVLSGPFCTMQLGDLGAEVVKIERPDGGDQTRGWTPPTYGDSEASAYYLSINRNKRSVTLNLASERGRELFRELAVEADVLVENFRVGKMAEWGLGYEALREENPGLVYCSISGYGQDGPYSDRPAYDLLMQAEGGMMSITGEPGRPPVRVGVAIADIVAGMYATQSILAALLDRELSGGGGEYIDVSLFDSIVALQTYIASAYFATGDPPGRMGSGHPNIVPYRAFPTADGYVVVACASENLWPKFCEALDRPDLVDEDRFATGLRPPAGHSEGDAPLADPPGGRRCRDARVADELRGCRHGPRPASADAGRTRRGGSRGTGLLRTGARIPPRGRCAVGSQISNKPLCASPETRWE